MKRSLVSLICVFFMFTLAVGQELVKIDKVYPEELEVQAFELSSSQSVNIDAVGLFETNRRFRGYDFTFGNAWILNTDTREIVWLLKEAELKFDDELAQFNGSVELPPGRYEAYYSSYPTYLREDDAEYWDDDYRDRRYDRYNRTWKNWMSRIFDGHWDRDYYYDDFVREFKFIVTGNGKKLSWGELEDIYEKQRSEAVISLQGYRDDRYETQGFILKKPMDLNIYALGEARRDGNFDYGIIINTKTLEKVWQLTDRDSDYAGGSAKNRMSRTTVSLPAGKYAAFYVTDDSHSPRDWNAAPPYDPEYWGLTVYAETSDMNSDVELFDYDGYQIENAIVEFTGLRDDEFREHGFTLKKPMKLRVYAIGEGRDGEMFDYGWIVDARTHKRIWEMDYYDTEHAGGDRKNRAFDDVIEFEEGSYLAYFVTDGSHSYRDWNTSPPFDQEHYGLTIIGVDDDFSQNDVAEYNESEDKSVLAKIVRVRDHDYKREEFELKDDGKVRIYAIGEGTRGRMYDYAWIENAETRRVVWEMTYRKTDHAGGARKNRLFDEVVALAKGKYIVYYETDDSHSFNDWNSSPPFDPINWGVTIYSIDD